MARSKQTVRKTPPKRPKRATMKDRKRDPTPEPSNPDNPCPTQLIGTGRGCSLCFPETKCEPGGRAVCQRVWEDKHANATAAIKQSREKQHLLEEELKQLPSHTVPPDVSGGELFQALPGLVLPRTSTPRSLDLGLNRRCITCNGPLDAPTPRPSRGRHNGRFNFQGAYQHSPQLECFDCRINGGASTSTARISVTPLAAMKQEQVSSSCLLKQEADTSQLVGTTIVVSSDEEGGPDQVAAVGCSKPCGEESSCSSEEAEQGLPESEKVPAEMEQDDDVVGNPLDPGLMDLPDLPDQAMNWEQEQDKEDSKENERCTVPAADSGSGMELRDWRHDKPTALSQFRHLLDNSLFTDCRLIVSEGANKKEFQCHRLLLARASQVFADMLYGPLAVVNQEDITIEAANPKAFEAMLQYIYSDQISLTSVRMALTVCAVACRFSVAPLVGACCAYMARHITPQTACRALDFSVVNHLASLQERCLKMMREQTLEVLESPGFLECSRGTLELLLRQDELRVSSELVLVAACERWASQKRHGAGELCPREALGTARQYLRFLTLSSAQFAQGPASSELLSQEEKLAVFVALATPSGSQQEPLPGGLCSTRRPRSLPQSLCGHNFLQSD